LTPKSHDPSITFEQRAATESMSLPLNLQPISKLFYLSLQSEVNEFTFSKRQALQSYVFAV